MSRLQLPKPVLDEAAEREIWRLMGKGFEPNRWRPDFDEWTQKRLWAEKHQGRMLDTLERWTGPIRGKSVLDLGTGRGGLAVALTLAGATVTAVDLRQRNLKILRLRGARYSLAVHSARCMGETLPFRNGSFDLVICKDVTEHCRSPRDLLREIARVLAPGGKAYVTFINRFAWIDPHYRIAGINFLPRFVAEAIIRFRGRVKDNIRDLQRLSDMHYFTRAAARRLTHSCNLEYHDVTEDRLRLTTDVLVRQFRRASYPIISSGIGTLEAVLAMRDKAIQRDVHEAGRPTPEPVELFSPHTSFGGRHGRFLFT
ncbi:MAG: class I SAM-dependent methyltransferase [Candidatus Sumerlaeaceae bacterium]